MVILPLVTMGDFLQTEVQFFHLLLEKSPKLMFKSPKLNIFVHAAMLESC